jgi:hypothetical protein
VRISLRAEWSWTISPSREARSVPEFVGNSYTVAKYERRRV